MQEEDHSGFWRCARCQNDQTRESKVTPAMMAIANNRSSAEWSRKYNTAQKKAHMETRLKRSPRSKAAMPTVKAKTMKSRRMRIPYREFTHTRNFCMFITK